MFSPLVKPFCKDQDDLKIVQQRSNKIALCFAKTIYYLIATVYGYQLLSETDFLPSLLGGKGDLRNCFNGVPF